MLLRPVGGQDLKTRLHQGFMTVSNDKVTIAAKHADFTVPAT